MTDPALVGRLAIEKLDAKTAELRPRGQSRFFECIIKSVNDFIELWTPNFRDASSLRQTLAKVQA